MITVKFSIMQDEIDNKNNFDKANHLTSTLPCLLLYAVFCRYIMPLTFDLSSTEHAGLDLPMMIPDVEIRNQEPEKEQILPVKVIEWFTLTCTYLSLHNFCTSYYLATNSQLPCTTASIVLRLLLGSANQSVDPIFKSLLNSDSFLCLDYFVSDVRNMEAVSQISHL